MDANDLRAMAERIIDTEEHCLSEYRVEEYDDPDWLQRINDRLAVARACLAEHDDTLADAAWMESVLGPRHNESSPEYERKLQGVRVYWFVSAAGGLVIRDRSADRRYQIDNRPRAEVLGLLRWLKVISREPPT